ncbi:MAG: ferrochelatase [bacterium]|nr:ferrochelatase [bacterium]
MDLSQHVAGCLPSRTPGAGVAGVGAAGVAVVLVNLGTPEEPTAAAVRPYLREFLTDRRVIETHPLLWRPILEGAILPRRPADSAEKYASIWGTGGAEGSPLLYWTERQRDLLAEELGGGIEVRFAMRYGSPSLRSVLDEIHAGGVRRVLVVPMYPQYSATSAGTVIDELARWTLAARDQMEMRTLRSFPDSPAYIEALAAALEGHWDEAGRPNFEGGERVVASFHSIPLAMHEAGDPYRGECELTGSLLRERLEIPEGGLIVTYQSVFGRAEWIGPATIETVGELGESGCARVDVVCPGFAADCLETLEEIDILNREEFTGRGGGEFHYVPWANDRAPWIAALVGEVEARLGGWVAL